MLELENIHKSFGSNEVLKGVNLSISPGEVVSIVGENGAGKSTLGKIIAGVHKQTLGTIKMDGKEVSFASTVEAREHGISIVLQEFNLIPEMTVAENLLLTQPAGYSKLGFRSLKSQVDTIREAVDRLNVPFQLPLETPVEELSVAQQQLVEIARALIADSSILILDEPTSALGGNEVDELLDCVEALRERGKGIVLVTHRLDEVFRVSDRIVVLRDGIFTGEFKPEETTSSEVVNAMVGRELSYDLETVRTIQPRGEVVLEVKDLQVAGTDSKINLVVHSGEVVGIAGLVGSGRTELMRAIYGADKRTGTVKVAGKEIRNGKPKDALNKHVALVTEDRKHQGLFLDLSIEDNMIVSNEAKNKNFLVAKRENRREISNLIEKLRIKLAGVDLPVTALSGGNQQKVILGKWLMTNPKLLILDEPTRGIDVGARADFYHVIDALVKEGMAVLLVSSEMQEVIALSDRLFVMSNGRFVNEFKRGEATEHNILASADGMEI
ncbi:sugar ABC transporter ATP-binding protein [Arcanobacterium urinimassiliense]|uniref:sugar ABC transporter ATP-binding protein n=1 Tax=Arcanobacterium urinimassiliense TaxID=1871014 RepID=UPI00093F430D|nr:sugar ABC transporter ATP-binding protein [Arcanobacterium urinimassiliense]